MRQTQRCCGVYNWNVPYLPVSDLVNTSVTFHDTFRSQNTALSPVPGARCQRGQKKRRWLDDLKEWSGITVPDLVSVAQDKRSIPEGSFMHSPTLDNGYR